MKSFSSLSSSSILANYASMFDNPELSDITIVLERGADGSVIDKIHAHKFVLFSKSSVLKDLINAIPGTKELDLSNRAKLSVHCAIVPVISYLYSSIMEVDDLRLAACYVAMHKWNIRYQNINA